MANQHDLRSCLIFLPMLVGACVATEEEFTEFGDIEEGETGDGTDTGADAEAASDNPPGGLESSEFVAPLSAEEAVGTRYCTQDNHCRSSCYCGADNTCTVGFVGPLPPDPESYCALAPVRPCASSLDCQSGCSCIESYCSPVGVSPQNPTCYLPPPDIYENDNTWTAWSSYVGSPQRHSFHQAGDNDWIAVYAHEAGLGRFETHSLANQADTKLKVFRYENGVKGELLGVSDDIGGPWYWPDSKSSRIDLYIPAGSTYLIKVVDRSPTSVYTDSLQFPEYTLELSYL